jgi:hypothetical protein
MRHPRRNRGLASDDNLGAADHPLLHFAGQQIERTRVKGALQADVIASAGLLLAVSTPLAQAALISQGFSNKCTSRVRCLALPEDRLRRRSSQSAAGG